MLLFIKQFMLFLTPYDCHEIEEAIAHLEIAHKEIINKQN